MAEQSKAYVVYFADLVDSIFLDENEANTYLTRQEELCGQKDWYYIEEYVIGASDLGRGYRS